MRFPIKIQQAGIQAHAAACLLLIACLAPCATARAKSIFDDDTPPSAPQKPAPLPVTPSPSAPKPVTPTTQSSPQSPSTKSTATQPIAPRHRQIPAKADQSRSRALFKETFAKELADHSPAGRLALSRKLLDLAGKSVDVPADHFVLLTGALDAAREAGDLSLCFRAIDTLAAAFDLDPLPLKSDAAVTLTPKTAAPATSLENSRAGLAIIEQSIEADDYLMAARILAALRPGAAADAPLALQYQTLTHQVEILRNGAALIAKDRETLKTSPDDPPANLAFGRFLCFTKGDWPRGLPVLAKSSDPALKALAIADLARPTEALAQADLADRWWDQSAREPSTAQKRLLRQRSAYWYEAAGSRLIGLRKTLADQRLADFRKTDAPELALSTVKLRFSGKPFEVRADNQWIPIDFTVTEGKCYRITSRGQWMDSHGAGCGPDGVCPKDSLTGLGPQPALSKQQREDYYLGQHPRSALIASVGQDKTGFFVGSEVTFLAPSTGTLSMRINDGDESSASRGGKLDIAISEVEPAWIDPAGTIPIHARVDDIDYLHITPEGVYWEYGGHWGKVGEHDGHYPTIINGILWWPKWIDKTQSELLKSTTLRLAAKVQLVEVEAKRGEVIVEKTEAGEYRLRFKDNGLGSSDVGCVVSLGPPASIPGSPGELLHPAGVGSKSQRIIPATPEQAAKAIASAKKRAQEVEDRMKVKFTTITSSHFLIFTDWDSREHDFLRYTMEQAYEAVSHEFRIPASDNVFIGKLGVYMFAKQADFQRFSKDIDGAEAPDNVLGYYMGNQLGFGHMAMWKPKTTNNQKETDAAERKWATTLTHEFTHAFVARYRTNSFIPRWLNEGMAEVVSHDQFPRAYSIYPYVRDRQTKRGGSLRDIFDDKGMLSGDDYPVVQTIVETLQTLRGTSFLPFFNDIKDGMEPEAALQKNYKIDFKGLESAWKDYIRDRK